MFSKSGKGKRVIKREFSAGGAVFKRKVLRVAPFDSLGGAQDKSAQGKQVPKAQEAEWLLIRHKGSKKWRLPKGNIEKGESSRHAAVREVWEETGIKAKVIEKLDSIRYFYILKGARIFKTVIFFLMEYARGTPRIDRRWAHEIEEVKWLPGNQALKSLSFRSEKEIIKKAALHVGG